MGRRQVTDQDRSEAKRLLLAWLIDGGDTDIDQLGFAAPASCTFSITPSLARISWASPSTPSTWSVSTERTPSPTRPLLADYLPEIEFRGKDDRKIRFAVLSTAARRAGLEADLLDEIRFWNNDFWRYALYASIALIRAAATKTNQPVSQVARRLAEIHDLDLV